MPINVEKLFENNYTLEEVLDEVRAYHSALEAEKQAKKQVSAQIEEEYIKASIAYFRDLDIIDADMTDEEATDLIRAVNKNIKVIFQNETTPIRTPFPFFKDFFEKF
jgi:hypothetical protein